jgi:hypothetical protein
MTDPVIEGYLERIAVALEESTEAINRQIAMKDANLVRMLPGDVIPRPVEPEAVEAPEKLGVKSTRRPKRKVKAAKVVDSINTGPSGIDIPLVGKELSAPQKIKPELIDPVTLDQVKDAARVLIHIEPQKGSDMVMEVLEKEGECNRFGNLKTQDYLPVCEGIKSLCGSQFEAILSDIIVAQGDA